MKREGTNDRTENRLQDKKKFQEKRQKLKDDWINGRGLGTREETEVKKKSEQNLRGEEGAEWELVLWKTMDRDMK